MGMIAISGNDVVVESDSGDGTCHNRFLTDIKMTKAADFLGLILLAGALFKTPDEQHQPEHLDFVALLRWLHCKSGSASDCDFSAGARRLNAHQQNEDGGEGEVAQE